MIFCSKIKCQKELILFCIYFHFPPSRRNEYQAKHILGRMIKSWSWSWLAPPQHQLGKFHHVAWSHQAAMILRASTLLFCKGLNIKGLMLLKGLSILEIYSDWTQACLIYMVWSTVDVARSPLSTLLFEFGKLEIGPTRSLQKGKKKMLPSLFFESEI